MNDPAMMDEFADWLASAELGQYLLAQEQAFFDSAVADVFGFRALQIGLCQHDFLAMNRIPWKGLAAACGEPGVVCDPAFLPFDSKSLDLVILPHGLDFTSLPHQVLREAARVLVPEGRLIITGFNPASLWGVRRLLQGREDNPWRGNFVSLPRIRDWLKLLELEHEATSFMAYSPPLARKDWLVRWQFMESTGARCWPLAAGVYGVVAVKRQRGMRLITPRWAPAKPARAMLVAGGNDRNPLTRTSDNETLHD
ncbi:class I SAM-dependent methyltransferase [Vogesella indigofera]|uniref:class I SAM-dependent methyltransferase n=1 Tax=Vogesella indigofera TaxID=45465 RepID=UPI00234FB4F0|nr:methyltransferase domain-containing protein [Vogesella indigofera]MDC7708017.1 methyltransferase domain-containing protein [Vogesella indigofera]